MSPWLQRMFTDMNDQNNNSTPAKDDVEDVRAKFNFLFKVAGDIAEAPDYEQAAAWYLKEAEQGDVLAQHNLGIMHSMGRGFVRNEIEATAWFRKAADQGNTASQYRLGLSHQRTSFRSLQENAPESRIEAYKWLQLSAAQDYLGSADACSLVTLKMSCEEVAEGNRRVQAFAPVPVIRN